jgi:hypothetical protein
MVDRTGGIGIGHVVIGITVDFRGILVPGRCYYQTKLGEILGGESLATPWALRLLGRCKQRPSRRPARRYADKPIRPSRPGLALLPNKARCNAEGAGAI